MGLDILQTVGGSEYCVSMEGSPVHEDWRSGSHLVTTEEKTGALRGGDPQAPSKPLLSRLEPEHSSPASAFLVPLWNQFSLWAEFPLVTMSLLSISSSSLRRDWGS